MDLVPLEINTGDKMNLASSSLIQNGQIPLPVSKSPFQFDLEALPMMLASPSQLEHVLVDTVLIVQKA